MLNKSIILNKALELYNKDGIEYVGVRPLAASMGLKQGNITYYFPMKEDVVDAIWLEFEAAITPIWQVREDITLKDFFEILEKNCVIQYKYRCLSKSLVHLITQYTKVSEKIRKEERRKKLVIQKWLNGMVEKKLLKELSEGEVNLLLTEIDFILNFWIIEASISHPNLSEKRLIKHYMGLVMLKLKMYSTKKGGEELEVLIS